MIRVAWNIEETVALADICIHRKDKTHQQLNEELESLSSALNYRADVLHIIHDDKFRNLNGLQFTYKKILYVFTDGAEGIANQNPILYDTYDLWRKRPDEFESILDDFNIKYR